MSFESCDTIIERLKQLGPVESIALVGMGNPDRGDDIFGIQLAEDLKAHAPDRIFSERERSLEGIVFGLIEREDIRAIVFIDAADFGEQPGVMHWFTSEDAERFVPAISTHKVPITLLMDLIVKRGKEPILIGLQPESLTFLGEMSITVKIVLNYVHSELKNMFTLR